MLSPCTVFRPYFTWLSFSLILLKNPQSLKILMTLSFSDKSFFFPIFQYISVSFLRSFSFNRTLIMITQLSPDPSSLDTSHTSIITLTGTLYTCKFTSAAWVLQTLTCSLCWASPLGWDGGLSNAPGAAPSPPCSHLWFSSLSPFLSQPKIISPEIIIDTCTLASNLLSPVSTY